MVKGTARAIVFLAALLMVAPGLFVPAHCKDESAAAKKTRGPSTILMGVTGEVSGVSSNFIAVTYSRDDSRGTEQEIAFELPANIELIHKKSVKEIGVGDIVEVQYYQRITIDANGSEFRKNVTKSVRFVRASTRKPDVPPPADTMPEGPVE